MKKIAISFDNKGYSEKPTKNEIAMINNRIAGSTKEYETDTKSLYELAVNIGQNGYSFCPATFKDGKRSQDSFEQQQIFALDFDNKDPEHSLRFEDAKKRAEKYDLPVLFAYETLSSHDHNKFRMVFLNDVSIPDRSVANAMLHAMGTIFPEADPQCYSDTSRIYFGGKSLLYYDEKLGMINIESVFRSMVNTVRERYGDKHYKEKLIRFSKKTGLSLNHNGLPDVRISYDSPYTSSVESTEDHGASDSRDTNSKAGGIRQSYIYNYEYSDGENSPKYYSIGIDLNAQRTSVGTSDRKADVPLISSKNHKEYRSSVLSDLKECKLFVEYINGSRNFVHNELFGLLTNMIQIETGIDYFMDVQFHHPEFYDEERISKWKRDASYTKMQGYHPEHCDKFCPYRNTCNHTNNILSTVHQKKGTIEKLSNAKEKYCSIEELQKDVYEALITAYTRSSADIFVIKAQTAAGKSHAYLKLMRENPNTRFLIAVPTNLLKHEIADKAQQNGIKVNVTPSLQEIADEIPEKIWKHIQRLYHTGRGKAVHRYINELLKKAMQDPVQYKKQKKELKVLEKYIEKRNRIRKSHGSIITTHRYLLNMDEERLKEYGVIIIDEDILFKGIVSNQEEISISDLEKAMTKINDEDVRQKIKKLLKKAEKGQSCIESKRIIWEDNEDDTHHKSPVKFDLPAFCRAEKFYIRRTTEEENIKEDTVIFIKPTELPNAKYIIVSATADEEIYQQYFSDRTVQFYECKRAKYAGTLRQYPQKSLSRSYIKSNPGIVNHIIREFSVPEENVITFKSEQVGELHFGNTEGSNAMEGEDILVIGTPNYPASLYKLTAFTMGIDVDEEDEMTSQCVTYNGFKFWITTFEDEDLRAVHFWMLESELEQAVGRARLLRHDCTVYLFSNFPLKQATFVYDFDYEEK